MSSHHESHSTEVKKVSFITPLILALVTVLIILLAVSTCDRCHDHDGKHGHDAAHSTNAASEHTPAEHGHAAEAGHTEGAHH